MASFDPLAHRYVLATLVDGRVTAQHRGLYLLAMPQAGSRLVLYGLEDSRRIVTSRIVRTFTHPGIDGTFIETGNSLYLLRLDMHGSTVRIPIANDVTAEMSLG